MKHIGPRLSAGFEVADGRPAGESIGAQEGSVVNASRRTNPLLDQRREGLARYALRYQG
jgi:hypothetical protein